MSDEIYKLTPDGKKQALGVVQAICHGYTLDQAAALNGMEDADHVKVMLYLICAEAGIVPPVDADDV